MSEGYQSQAVQYFWVLIFKFQEVVVSPVIHTDNDTHDHQAHAENDLLAPRVYSGEQSSAPKRVMQDTHVPQQHASFGDIILPKFDKYEKYNNLYNN